ncbi:ImmA/IrrE family metallo-endopeptidase [uncultured Brevundimonas sp.]|uniref:ImmA/IrrE family metallo-endopeptidase n=1 Tax=uncultured Brevundimonas sp. TaxID=213418 RepID=UPI0030EEA290|tara:strand:- start:4016 stop:5170 length:1155 start_codon:yes stop_codon:yes gene_type:complete
MKIAPIRTEETYQASLARAAVLISRSDASSVDELEIIQALVERWEKSQYDLPAPTAVEAIRFRMSQRGLQPRDLEPYIGSRARVSEVLSGRRDLSIDMIRSLNQHLGIPAAALIAAPAREASAKVSKPSKAALDKLRTFGVLKARETYEQFIDRIFPPSAAPAFLRKTRTDRTNAKTDLAALHAWCAAVVVKADAVKMPAKRPVIKSEWGIELARLSQQADGLSLVEAKLRAYGIVFVALEHLPGTYLDGAALCRSDSAPVIAMTLRHDRLDNFWFTLLHEFCHVARHLNADRRLILDDLDLKGADEIEDEADRFAQDALIPPNVWKKYVADDLDTDGVLAVALKAKVHPAVVAGRWQRENQDYRRFAKLLGRGEVRSQLFGDT